MRQPNGKSGLVSVVIPTRNEAKNITRVIEGVKQNLAGYDYEIIVVDDTRSSDGTGAIAKRHGARVLRDSIGKGSALLKGLRAAKGDVLISMDADLSHEPKELRLLIDAISIGYDVCMGSRFITGGGSEDIPPFRVFGNKFFVFLVNLLFGAHYTDMCYGYRSFRKGVLSKLGLKELGFGIETEINIKSVKCGLKVIEMPSMEKRRVAGEAKLRTFRDGWAILTTIARNIL